MKAKVVRFDDSDDQHARMIIRLRYDKLTQGNFFRGIVELYVNNDLDFAKVVEKIKRDKSTIGKKKASRSVKEMREGETMMRDLGLTNNEKNFIYDLIEEDFEE
jgi:hypothetical protein